MSAHAYRCARCHRPMHHAQNSRLTPDGVICMACYNGPRILWREPEPDDPSLN